MPLISHFNAEISQWGTQIKRRRENISFWIMENGIIN